MVAQAGGGVAGGESAGVILGAVDAIGIGGKGSDAVEAVEADRQREQELAVAPAAAVAVAAVSEGDGGLAAREDHGRAGERPPAQAGFTRDGGMDPGDLASL